jgi:hypothetical protein
VLGAPVELTSLDMSLTFREGVPGSDAMNVTPESH